MRSQELPVIACSLTPREMADRSDAFHHLFLRSLLSAERAGSALRLRFYPDALPRVMDLVIQESVCCPFFEMQVVSLGDSVELSIGGPSDAGPLLDSLYVSATSALSDPGA